MKSLATLAAAAFLGATAADYTASTPPDEAPAKEVIQEEAPSMAKPAPEEAEEKSLHLHATPEEAEAACGPQQTVLVIYTDPATCLPCRRLEEALFAEHMHAWLSEWFSIAVVKPERGQIPTSTMYLPGKDARSFVGFTSIKTYTEWMRRAHRELTRK